MEIQNAWYRISAKALIYNEKGEFLLAKEDNGVWDIPGGGLDHGENPQNCIKRELQEEMGLEVVDISENPKYFLTAHKAKSKTRPWIANVFYEVKVKNLDFTPSDECIEIGFFDKNTIKNISVIENVEEFIKLL
ncbi:ADP-ribose pyrophosphatase [Candidatus Gracilibacteria bacterium]|nr:MAG: ADP-ribose pyrophosphatase [Candidatus Gracilibacteria bacterium]PIE85686.1 MAG: ADP-ribose pyrophosphatase [Candidatus Gracilibacteria bacterium]